MSDQPGVIIVKRTKKVHRGSHGGAWKVAYADFVTAMMAFFLLLWLVGNVPDKNKYELAGYLENYSPFNPEGESYTAIPDPMAEQIAIDREKELAMLNAATTVADELRHRLGPLWQNVIVKTSEGEVRIHLVDKDGAAMFEVGSSKPTGLALEILERLVIVLKKTEYRIAVEGHTDQGATDDEEVANWTLSTLRAVAARNALVGFGLTSKYRYDRVAGYASTRPLNQADPHDPQNRRVSLLLLTYGSVSGQKAEREVTTKK
jgi:chemotaxis protein MotB